MEQIPVIALQFFLLFSVLPENVDKFTMSSEEFGRQEWQLKGHTWVVKDEIGKEIFSVDRNGNEIRVVTTRKYGSDYCKDSTAFVSAVPRLEKDGSLTFDVRSRLGPPVRLQKNSSGLVFYQDGDKFIFRHPVLVIYNK